MTIATQYSSSSVHSNENRHWVKPPNGIMKLNTDAACHAQFGFVGLEVFFVTIRTMYMCMVKSIVVDSSLTLWKLLD